MATVVIPTKEDLYQRFFISLLYVLNDKALYDDAGVIPTEGGISNRDSSLHYAPF